MPKISKKKYEPKFLKDSSNRPSTSSGEETKVLIRRQLHLPFLQCRPNVILVYNFQLFFLRLSSFNAPCIFTSLLNLRPNLTLTPAYLNTSFVFDLRLLFQEIRRKTRSSNRKSACSLLRSHA